jgi:hypothetical protein
MGRAGAFLAGARLPAESVDGGVYRRSVHIEGRQQHRGWIESSHRRRSRRA